MTTRTRRYHPTPTGTAGRRATLALFLVLLISPFAAAAPSATGPRVTLVPWAARMPEVLLLKTGSKVEEVGLTPMSPTQPIRLGADRTFSLALPPPPSPTPAAGAPASAPSGAPSAMLFEYKVPVGMEEVLLIVSPDAAGWKSVLLKNDARSFPAESLLLVNVSPVAATLQAGDQVVELQPGENRVVALTSGKTRRTFVRVALRTAEGWGRPAGSPINLPDGGRGLVLVGRSDQTALAATEAETTRRAPQPRLVTAVDMPPPVERDKAAGSAR